MLGGYGVENSTRVEVKFNWIDCEASGDLGLPNYETEGSAGMDVQAAIEQDLVIEAGDIVLIPTGFRVAIPYGFEIQIRPRSGLAIRHGITIVNSPGTIDSDYRGEVKIGLINLGRKAFVLRRGDRVGQMILAPVSKMCLVPVEQLDETERGSGGFGHTGLR